MGFFLKKITPLYWGRFKIHPVTLENVTDAYFENIYYKIFHYVTVNMIFFTWIILYTQESLNIKIECIQYALF